MNLLISILKDLNISVSVCPFSRVKDLNTVA